MFQPDDYPTDAFVIDPSAVDLGGRLRLSSLVSLMQDAANLNAGRHGFSIDNLADLGLGWVLMRLNISVIRWPRVGDTLHIGTFPTHRDRYFISRDYHGFDTAGQAVVQAGSTWLTFSMTSRAMSPLPDLMLTVPLPTGPFLPKLPPKLRFTGTVIHTDTCRVSLAQTDHNRHTNNSAYVQMLTDALPPQLDTRQLAGLDLFFKTETFPGDVLLAETAQTEHPDQFWHRLSRPADGKDVLIARSTWQPTDT